MIVSECVIVVALAIVAWHMVASPPAPQISGVRAASPTAQVREPAIPGAKIVAGTTNAPVKSLLPGLNVDSSFWRLRLAELNRGEASFEQLEWRIVHAAMDAARRYVKSVVMPALVRAARTGR
jgi:hypothetical protein